MTWWQGVQNRIHRRRRPRRLRRATEDTGHRRPSRLTDAAVALLLAVADALALAGAALFTFLLGMSRSEPPGDGPTSDQPVPFFHLTLVWIIPAALAVSCYAHARLRMPLTSAVQGLFFIIGTTLATGQTRMLLSFT
ncbi:hypothetical protein [Streptomyces sp. NPDC002788]